MCDHFKKIYRQQAQNYERLVAREDQHGNLFEAVNDIVPLHGKQIVEFGAGTGRLTRLLAVVAAHVFAFDIEPTMLTLAATIMRETGLSNWSLALGDNASMPVASSSADLVIEGWSFAHAVAWYPRQWQERANAMLAEMRRILKPGGTAILVETLGTGRRQPQAPTPDLAALYNHWAEHCGFDMRWIRTDYQFATAEEANELTRFFFGDALADECLAPGSVLMPECTGIWWRTY